MIVNRMYMENSLEFKCNKTLNRTKNVNGNMIDPSRKLWFQLTKFVNRVPTPKIAANEIDVG